MKRLHQNVVESECSKVTAHCLLITPRSLLSEMLAEWDDLQKEANLLSKVICRAWLANYLTCAMARS